MESSNAAALLEDDDCMPIQSSNPITQLGGDDGHLPMGAGLLSLGGTCDIHTTKKKMNASTVDSALVLLPGILQLHPSRDPISSSHPTIGRLEGFHQQDGTPSSNNLTLTLGGSCAMNSSETENGKNKYDVPTESPKVILRGRAMSSKTTFVLLHVTPSSKKTKTIKKQAPPKVVCKGVYRNVLVFGEGMVKSDLMQSGIDEPLLDARPWRHSGASERCDRDHCDDEEEEVLASSIPVQKNKQTDDAMQRSTLAEMTRQDPVQMVHPVNDARTRAVSRPLSIKQRDSDVEKSDSSCCILNNESKEPSRRLSARRNKQRVSYKEFGDEEGAEGVDDCDAKPIIAKKVKIEQTSISSASQREMSRKRQSIESPVSPLDDDVVVVGKMETDIVQQPSAVVKVDASTTSQTEINSKLRGEDAPLVSSRLPPPTDASSTPSKAIMEEPSLSSTKRSMQKPNEEMISLDLEQAAASSSRHPPTSVLFAPSALPTAKASTPSSNSKKRRRRPIMSTPPKAKAQILTVDDDDDEFAFLGE
jgi:hypothetical protein